MAKLRQRVERRSVGRKEDTPVCVAVVLTLLAFLLLTRANRGGRPNVVAELRFGAIGDRAEAAAYIEGVGPPPNSRRGHTDNNNLSAQTAKPDPIIDAADAEVVPWGPSAVRASSLLSHLVAAYEKLGIGADDSKLLFADMKTPQGRAYEWILNRDERKVGVNDGGVVQRYVLAVLFYSTGGDGKPAATSGNVEGANDAGQKNEWKHGRLQFLSPSDECQWYSKVRNAKLGVKACSAQNQVTELFLPSTGLVGTVPSELGLLSELTYLDLGNNGLRGSVPEALGQLAKLGYLSLNQNDLTGTVPHVWGGMDSLEQLLLHRNGITGMVPESVCKLRIAGALYNVWTDCDEGSLSPVTCKCCTVCCDSRSKCGPKTVEKRGKDDEQ